MEKTKSTTEITSLDLQFKRMEKELDRENFSAPITAFKDNSEKARKLRIKKAMKNFWEFDRIYFPPEYHKQGFYEPGVLHHTIFDKTLENGIHWFGTFRNLAKSAYLKKIRIWYLLTGRASIGAITGETLDKSRNFVKAIENILEYNQRIKSDFNIEIDISNDKMLRFSSSEVDGFSYYMPYSLDANARGDNVDINRFDFMDFDDLETNRMNFTEFNTNKRMRQIIEAYRSCKDNANMIGLGNNIHPKCLFNRLKKAQEKGEKIGLITVYPFPVWSNEMTKYTPYVGSVWFNKYKAQSKEEMMIMINPQDDVEKAEADCNPILKSGHIFPKEYLRTYYQNELPSDAFGPAFCDPNLSEKGLGDTTGMAGLLYSRANDLYYVYKPLCKSYSDSNFLLLDYLKMFDHRIQIMAMDGNVNQESQWRNNIRNFIALNRIPLPPIIFCKYTVDMISQHLSAIYKQGKLRFPVEYLETEEGQEAIEQFYTFGSKKENGKDDFPDCLISAYQLGMERGMFIPNDVSGGDPYEVRAIGFGHY